MRCRLRLMLRIGKFVLAPERGEGGREGEGDEGMDDTDRWIGSSSLGLMATSQEVRVWLGRRGEMGILSHKEWIR